MDDVFVFSATLTAGEILTLYTAGRGALDQRVSMPLVRGFGSGGSEPTESETIF